MFGGGSNPFVTAVGQLIDTATDPTNPEENLELFFEVCDMIDTNVEVAKDAMRAIRKKLNIYSGKNWAVVMKLLKLLDICTNNCNRKFQIQLTNKDFLHELKSMIGPKLQPPVIIQEKVLSLIQKWAILFRGDNDFKSIDHFYTELKQKGIEFPDPNSTSNADPLENTPQIPSIPVGAMAQQPNLHSQNLKTILPGSAAAVRLNEDQMAKLKSELDIVDNNVQVMNDVLTEHQPNISDSKKSSSSLSKDVNEDISLLKELFITTTEMQKRITQLIGNVANETIIGDLLRINDDLNNVFVRYERFLKGSNFSKPAEPTSSTKMPVAHVVQEKSLIDFGDDGTIANDINIDLLNLNSTTTTNLKTQVSKNCDEDAFLQDENEIAEMENWLKTQELENSKNNANKTS